MKFEIDKKYIFRVNRFKKINKLVFYGKTSFNVGVYSSWSMYVLTYLVPIPAGRKESDT
jgi:hypothetical protein